jgi:hypothetical protein
LHTILTKDSNSRRAANYKDPEDEEADMNIISREIIYALGEIKSKKSISVLSDILKNDKSERVRSDAAKALGRIKSEEVVSILEEISENDPSQNVRTNAALSLSMIRPQKEESSFMRTLRKGYNAGILTSIKVGLNELFVSIKEASVLDITNLYAVYIDPIDVSGYFPEKNKNINYKALIAFPLGGNDYMKTGGTPNQLRKLGLDNILPKKNSGSRPYVGNFYLNEEGKLRVTFDNIPENKVLFQLKVEKIPEDEEIPRDYQEINLLDPRNNPINGLILTKDSKYIFLKGGDRKFFEYANIIAKDGYLFRVDAGSNTFSYTSDPELLKQEGWVSSKSFSANIIATAGVAFYYSEPS